MFLKDLGRSFIFVLLVFVLLLLFMMNKINRNIVIYLIAGLVIMDMWFVNKRYFNTDHFVDKEKYESFEYQKKIRILLKRLKELEKSQNIIEF